MCSTELSVPLQTGHHLSDSVDQALVLLGVGQNEAMQLLHVAVDGVQRGRLPTAYRWREHLGWQWKAMQGKTATEERVRDS